jgi:sugar phosphate isomerase/epimerase
MVKSFKLGLACAYSSVLYAEFDRTRGVYTKAPSVDDIAEQVRRTRELGYDGVELEALMTKQLDDFTDENVSKLRKLCESLNLEVPSFYVYFAHSNLSRPEKNEDFKRVCKVAAGLGARVIGLLSPRLEGAQVVAFDHKGGAAREIKLSERRASWKEQWAKFVSAISDYADVASSFKLKIAVEPRPYDIINNTERCLLLMEATKGKPIGIFFDTAHMFVQKEVLEVSIEKLGQNILVMHLADNDGKTDYHSRPGNGSIDWKSVLSTLRKIGYNGYLNIEIGETENLVKEYLKGREYIESLS